MSYLQLWQYKCFRLELLRLATWTCSLCIWPILWTYVATPDTCVTCSKVGLIWPYLLIILDMFIYTKDMRPSMNLELNTTTSFAFTIAGMLGAIGDPIRSRFFVAATRHLLRQVRHEYRFLEATPRGPCVRALTCPSRSGCADRPSRTADADTQPECTAL